MLKKRRSSRRRRTRSRMRRTRVRRTKKKSLSRKIKDIQLRQCEQHVIGGFTNTLNTAVTFFGLQPLNDVLNDPTTSTTRIWNFRRGQEYILQRFQINMNFHNIPDATLGLVPICNRVMIIEGRQLGGTSDPLPGTAMWMGVEGVRVSAVSITGLAQSMTYKIDPKYYRTWFDKRYWIGHKGNGNESLWKRIVVRVNKKISTNQLLEGNQEQNRRFWLLVLHWCPRNNSSQLVGVGTEWKTFFKDP